MFEMIDMWSLTAGITFGLAAGWVIRGLHDGALFAAAKLKYEMAGLALKKEGVRRIIVYNRTKKKYFSGYYSYETFMAELAESNIPVRTDHMGDKYIWTTLNGEVCETKISGLPR